MEPIPLTTANATRIPTKEKGSNRETESFRFRSLQLPEKCPTITANELFAA